MFVPVFGSIVNLNTFNFIQSHYILIILKWYIHKKKFN